ncbi:hypothetical protein VTK26DRAFT_4807 [Humicola hyalothermophila]
MEAFRVLSRRALLPRLQTLELTNLTVRFVDLLRLWIRVRHSVTAVRLNVVGLVDGTTWHKLFGQLANMYSVSADLDVDMALTAPRQLRLAFAWLAEKSDRQEGDEGEGENRHEYKVTGLFFRPPQRRQLRGVLKCKKCWTPVADDCYRRYCPHISIHHTLDLSKIGPGTPGDLNTLMRAVVMTSEELTDFRQRYSEGGGDH